jgi:hypothetical protein
MVDEKVMGFNNLLVQDKEAKLGYISEGNRLF